MDAALSPASWYFQASGFGNSSRSSVTRKRPYSGLNAVSANLGWHLPFSTLQVTNEGGSTLATLSIWLLLGKKNIERRRKSGLHWRVWIYPFFIYIIIRIYWVLNYGYGMPRLTWKILVGNQLLSIWGTSPRTPWKDHLTLGSGKASVKPSREHPYWIMFEIFWSGLPNTQFKVYIQKNVINWRSVSLVGWVRAKQIHLAGHLRLVLARVAPWNSRRPPEIAHANLRPAASRKQRKKPTMVSSCKFNKIAQKDGISRMVWMNLDDGFHIIAQCPTLLSLSWVVMGGAVGGDYKRDDSAAKNIVRTMSKELNVCVDFDQQNWKNLKRDIVNMNCPMCPWQVPMDGICGW